MSDTEPNQSSTTSRPNGPHLIRGVALDMDGLLFDTEALYWQVGDTILQRRGFRFSKALQQNMMGRVGEAAMQQMIDFHTLDESPAELLAESNELFGNLLTTDLKPMPGLAEWIDQLRSSGLPFGLATSSQRRFVDVIFEQIDWRETLAFTLTGDDVTRGKPDPQMYLMAAEKMQINPEVMLVLEDSGNGCAAAVAAQAFTVAIPSEHTREQSFDGARLIADSLLDTRLWALLPNR